MSVESGDYTEYDWFGEAKIREKAGNSEGALKAYEEAIKLNPSFEKAWFYKAQLHHRLGQKDEAIACAKKTIELKPAWEKHVRKFLPDIIV